MYAERNLITLTSCEVGYVRAAWYGGSTIQLRCKNVPCIRSYYGTPAGFTPRHGATVPRFSESPAYIFKCMSIWSQGAHVQHANVTSSLRFKQ